MQEPIRLALAPVFVAAFLAFTGMFLNCGQAQTQSREEPSKPPAPVRPPGTTGVTGARPEASGKGLGSLIGAGVVRPDVVEEREQQQHQIEQNAAALERQKRELEALKKEAEH